MITWIRGSSKAGYWHVLTRIVHYEPMTYANGTSTEGITLYRPGCQSSGWSEEYVEKSTDDKSNYGNACPRCIGTAHLVNTGKPLEVTE